MRVEILGNERRRRWSDETKLDIVTAVGIDGASVTQVADRHDVTRQQIYSWRRALRLRGLLSGPKGAVFVPVDMPLTGSGSSMGTDGAASAGRVDVQLRCGRCLRIEAGIDVAVLRRLIQAVEAA